MAVMSSTPQPAADCTSRGRQPICQGIGKRGSTSNRNGPHWLQDAPHLSPAALEALLGAWFASQNRSLFAAKCFIETVLELHRGGTSLGSVQLGVSTASLESRQTLLTPLEQDILLLWVAIVMLTLEEVGVPRHGQVRGAAPCRSSTRSNSMCWVSSAGQEPRQLQLKPVEQDIWLS